MISMQEPVSTLSQEQIQTLQSTYTCLRVIAPYVQALIPCLRGWDELHAKNMHNFAQLCLSKLVQHFPEVAEFQRGNSALPRRESSQEEKDLARIRHVCEELACTIAKEKAKL
jgi:hypothetical protein